MTVTTKVDLRKLFGPIRDQGQRGTCLAFATSDHHAALRGTWAPLSCEYLFYHAQRRANRPPTVGAVLPAMLDALLNEGQPHETVWPYLAAVPADTTQWVPPSSADPVFKRAGDAGSGTVDAIVAELNLGKPVVTLMRLSHSFDWVSSGGIVDEAPGEKPELNRRHAVIAVGHGELAGQRAVLIRNSWGAGWGLGGYGWLTEKYLQPRVFRLAILKEDISVSQHSAAA